MTELVVDPLEPIEVDEEQRARGIIVAFGQPLRRVTLEAATIEHAGQRIGRRDRLHLALFLLAVGDVHKSGRIVVPDRLADDP